MVLVDILEAEMFENVDTDMLMSPLTSSAYWGLLVPIPIRPLLVINNPGPPPAEVSCRLPPLVCMTAPSADADIVTVLSFDTVKF